MWLRQPLPPALFFVPAKFRREVKPFLQTGLPLLICYILSHSVAVHYTISYLSSSSTAIHMAPYCYSTVHVISICLYFYATVCVISLAICIYLLHL